MMLPVTAPGRGKHLQDCMSTKTTTAARSNQGHVLTPGVSMAIGGWLLGMAGVLSFLNPSEMLASAIFRLSMVASGFAFYAHGRRRKRDEKTVPEAVHADMPTAFYRGLRGGLILFGITLGIFLAASIVQLVSDVPVILAGRVWADFTTPGTMTHHPTWAWLLALDWGGNIFAVVFTSVLLALFLQKKKSFPRLAIGGLAACVVLGILRYFLVNEIPHLRANSFAMPFLSLVVTVIQAVVWIPYLHKSRRVRATFVN